MQGLPSLAMTAHAMKGQQQACLDAGFDDFISKPLAREDLLAAQGDGLDPGAADIDADDQVLVHPGLR